MAHDKTLCKLSKSGFIEQDFKTYKTLVQDGRFVCRNCGRVARKKKMLCEPKRLYSKNIQSNKFGP